jgi:H/ACA ribonucleoprotein complex subunit 3
MPSFIINSIKKDVSASDIIGEGGEAEIYKIGAQTVAKLFKRADHPDFAHNPHMALLAEQKDDERQNKLPHFPKTLPKTVIAPADFLYSTNRNKPQHIIGYTMPYILGSNPILEFTQRDFREKNDIGRAMLSEIFMQMHRTLSEIHAQDVIVGDFNSLNVLVQNKDPFFIDADSMQFNGFLCSGFTSRYVDPVLCQNMNKAPVLCKPYNRESDWYAFAVMLFESLLFVHPFGGVYKPTNLQDRVSAEERPVKRISIFHPEVQYPKVAEPLSSIPKDLRRYFEDIFERQQRRDFPYELLDFAATGIAMMPMIAIAPIKKSYIAANGQLACIEIFETSGRIQSVAWHDNKLVFVYWEGGKYLRENALQILAGASPADISFKLCGNLTIANNKETAFVLQKGSQPEKLSVDLFRDEFPVLATNSTACFYVDGGNIWKYSQSKMKRLEEAMPHQTRLWVGEQFGLAFYQASQFRRAFVFDLNGNGKILLPPDVIPSNVISASCHISNNVAWLFTQRLEGTRFVNRCSAVDRKGNVLATCEAPMSDDGWLGHLSGKAAASKEISPGVFADFLLSTINGGIVQIAIDKGQIVELKEFDLPEATTADNLTYSPNGLYLWNSKRITLLSSDLKKLKQGSAPITTGGAPS